METKKAWGVSTSAHPCVQAFALPLCKDKQRSQPTPSDYICNYWLYIMVYSNSWDIIHPRRRSVALPLCTVSKLRSLNTQNDNVRKRLFPLALPYEWHRRPLDFLKSFDSPCPRRTGLVGAKIQNRFETTKKTDG